MSLGNRVLYNSSGMCTLTLTNPFWVAKTRLCLQYDKYTHGSNYNGMFDCLVKIYKADGIRGLYKVIISNYSYNDKL